MNPNIPMAETNRKDLQAAAGTLGLQIHVLHASTESELDTVFANLVELRAGGLVNAVDDSSVSRREQICRAGRPPLAARDLL